MFLRLHSYGPMVCGFVLLMATGADAHNRQFDGLQQPAAEPTDAEISAALTAAHKEQLSGESLVAARRYGEAYGLIAANADHRGTSIGEDAVVNAASAYRVAFDGSERDYEIVRESQALLLRFSEDWSALGRPVPSRIRDELAWVTDRLAEEPAEPPVVTPPEVPVEVPKNDGEDKSDDDADDIAEVVAAPSKEPDDRGPTTTDKPTRPTVIGGALIGAGAVATLGGAVALALGAPLRGRAEDYRDEVLGSEDFAALPTMADQATAREHLDDYVQDERQRGVTLMAVGGTAVGIGVTSIVVGAVTLARGRKAESARGHAADSRRAAFVVSPRIAVGRRHAMASVTLGF